MQLPLVLLLLPAAEAGVEDVAAANPLARFGDSGPIAALSEREFAARYHRPHAEQQPTLDPPLLRRDRSRAAPSSVDWRDATKNPKKLVAVTAVKDQ